MTERGHVRRLSKFMKVGVKRYIRVRIGEQVIEGKTGSGTDGE